MEFHLEMEEIFSHYSSIMDSLLRTPFYMYYFQRPYAREYGSDLGDNMGIWYGATRGCIVDEMCDWVVKFVTKVDAADNACEREVRNYVEAINKGLGCYFVECRFLGVYRKRIRFFKASELEEFAPNEEEEDWVDDAAKIGLEMEDIWIEVPLYAYRRAAEPHIKRFLSQEEIKLGNSLRSPIAENYIETAVALWNEYGEDEFWKIDAFCRVRGIGDLHTGNLGRLDGNLVIIDYASYLGD